VLAGWSFCWAQAGLTVFWAVPRGAHCTPPAPLPFGDGGRRPPQRWAATVLMMMHGAGTGGARRRRRGLRSAGLGLRRRGHGRGSPTRPLRPPLSGLTAANPPRCAASPWSGLRGRAVRAGHRCGAGGSRGLDARPERGSVPERFAACGHASDSYAHSGHLMGRRGGGTE
jgi:hypothetical protein